MRVAIAQINPILGNFEFNKDKILNFTEKAVSRHCDLVVFPECALFGYHPFDLLERTSLVEDQLKALKEIERKLPKKVALLLGLITKNEAKCGRPYFNSAALVQSGKKTQFFNKQLLPTGDVFDEARFIEHGDTAKNFFKIKGQKVLVTICEDIWAWEDEKGHSQYIENPLKKLKKEKPDLVVNLSASPFYPGKLRVREKLVEKTTKHFSAPMLYCNMVGAQDEIIFDGLSFAIDEKGKKICQSVAFEEELNIFDLRKMEGGLNVVSHDAIELTQRALVLGLRDFCEKTGLKKVHLGLSGGIDSAVVACLAVDALGPQNVVGISLPSDFNSPESERLSMKLAKNLGMQCLSVPISESYEVLKKTIDQKFQIEKFGIVHENLQARIRGLLMMGYSNHQNSMLLTTCNKSELASGYSTLYGDVCGGLAPIGDLTKHEVYEIAELYNAEAEVIPNEIITRAPSAELRPNQKDQDSLPDYEKLDKAVIDLVEKGKKASSETETWLLKALFKSEFKRWQSPPILKVRPHSFGRGRRWPVSHQSKV